MGYQKKKDAIRKEIDISDSSTINPNIILKFNYTPLLIISISTISDITNFSNIISTI